MTGRTAPRVDESELARRWRLVLGEEGRPDVTLGRSDGRVDGALAAVYDTRPETSGGRSASLGSSAPAVVRWLGDIRTYFPTSVVEVVQRDAVDRLGLRRLLLEPELLTSVQPDVSLVATLVSLKDAMPETTRSTARQVVAQVVAEIERRIMVATTTAVSGALRRERTHRPRLADVDWPATIRANLRHYLPELGTIVPERLIGTARRGGAVARDVILAVDQSGSMASSVVYSAVFGAVLATMRSVRTSFVVFDTEVVDLTAELTDPVDLLFGTQLGGGTDIDRAVAYCADLVGRPEDTVMFLVTDLYEGGDRASLVRRVAALRASGVLVIVLPALSDDGTPAFHHDLAAELASLGVPTFACTPDTFPDLLAMALTDRDVSGWSAGDGATGR